MLRGVYMIVNSKKRLCAFKWTDSEVKKEIQKHLENIEIKSQYFGKKDGHYWYVSSLDEFEGLFLPPSYYYWNNDTKQGQYFDIPVKIIKTKVSTKVKILNIAIVEYMEFDEKILFTIIYK